MKPCLAALCALSLASAPGAADEPVSGASFAQALAAAKARHAPVFIDFHAPWCHSCFFMEKNVMNGAEWEAVTRRAVTTDVDSDSPEGTVVAGRFDIKAWPTYVVLDEDGNEIGRILGDRARAQFYQELDPLLDHGAVLDRWKARVVDDSKDSMAAARTVLKAYYEREDYGGGTAWLSQLPDGVRKAMRADAAALDLVQRIALLDAAKRGDAPACLSAAPPVLGGEIGCDDLTEVSEFQQCLAKLPPSAQSGALLPLKPRMVALQQRILVEGKGVCSDTRGIVETAADLYDELADTAASEQVLRQGVAYCERGLGGDYSRDRHLADNLRYYLSRLQDDEQLDKLFPKLIAAYPDPYDYYLRYGKNLAKREQFEKALGYLEQAAPRSYGRNRLWVAQWRAYVLLKLGREADAKKVASEALRANGPWFEGDVAMLKSVLEGKVPD